jgi:hypothetical protein
LAEAAQKTNAAEKERILMMSEEMCERAASSDPKNARKYCEVRLKREREGGRGRERERERRGRGRERKEENVKREREREREEERKKENIKRNHHLHSFFLSFSGGVCCSKFTRTVPTLPTSILSIVVPCLVYKRF